MNNEQSPLNNPEDHEKLVHGLKQDIQQALADAEKWQKSYLKSEDALAETERQKRQLENDKADLKRQLMAQRRIELDSQETKQANDFLANLNNRLDAKINQAN